MLSEAPSDVTVEILLVACKLFEVPKVERDNYGSAQFAKHIQEEFYLSSHSPLSFSRTYLASANIARLSAGIR
jgi:hypothetical protein